MYKILIAIAFLLLAPLNFLAQNWAWMKGDTIFPGNQYYGFQGQANIFNNPPSKWQAAHTTDNQNNLWMFGGLRQDSPALATYNDLWKFDAQTNLWTWVKGDSVYGKKSIYGTKGSFNINNKPGGRAGATMLTDNLGNLWLFGGSGIGTNNGVLNDLWKYNISANEWAWISGDSTTDQHSNYGLLGVANSNNKPGGRRFVSQWIDNSGNFWFFGGEGYANSGSAGYLNDLWKYNPVLNQWTWVKGDSIVNQSGSFGAIGVTSISNKPSTRANSSHWKDNAGNFWLFGGSGFINNYGELNDLWKLNPLTNQWTWMKGSNFIDPIGNYGIMGIANSLNTPSGRSGSAFWKDASGNFWIHCGNYKNDLWRYNLTSNQWTWIKGDTTSTAPHYFTGFYGSQGTFAQTNKPSARIFSSFWTNSSNALWLFGGGRQDCCVGQIYNDLWKFDLSEYVGLKENVYENNNIKIYPNPTYDLINIEIKEKGDFLLTIYDAQGKSIYTNENINTSTTISLKNFAAGIYNFVLITEKGIISKKIILN
jgi:hypothetical protein